MNTTKLRRATIATAATTLGLTACGGTAGPDSAFTEQSSVDIAKVAFKEMRDVKSLRMLGTVESISNPVRFDVRADIDRSCTGSIEVQGGRAQFRQNAEAAWIKPDEGFWRALSPTPQQANQMITLVGPSWLKAEDDYGFKGFCNLAPLLAEFRLDKTDTEDTVTKGGVELIGETEAIKVSARDGKARSSVWVSVAAPHHVVKMVSSEKGDEVTFYFEEFDVEVQADSPAEDDVVDLP